MKNSKAVEEVQFQRRVLLGITFGLLFSILVWIVAIGTDHWYEVEGGNGLYVPKTRKYLISSHSGLWKTCRTAYPNNARRSTKTYRCSYYDFVPTKQDETTKNFMDYQRTVAAFSIISLLIMIMGFAFSIYTFFQTRYMYKRLTAGCHAIAAGCALIVIEVSVTMIHYAEENLKYRHPLGSTWNYGFSFVLAWITFIAEVTAAIAFAVCSRKRKKDKAPDDQYAIEEEPTIIGR